MTLINTLKNASRDFPHEIAIKGTDFAFTYNSFDIVTHNFACKLLSHGVQPNDTIGICLERSPEMLVGIFGILKAAAAYLPVDASHPPKRIQSVLNDAVVKWVVTTPDLSGFVSSLGFIPIIPDCEPITTKQPGTLPQIEDETTAYILFTSGSTGKPKGVEIPHRAVTNLITYMQQEYPIGKGDVVLLKSPYTFDGSIWELFGWMEMGGTLFISPPGQEKDPAKLSEIIQSEHVSFLFFVPSMLRAFVSYCLLQNRHLPSLKWVSVGGEVLPVQLVEAFYQFFDYEKVKLINVYGPTETTVYATTFCCNPPESNEQKIPIGYPVTNDIIYILNENLTPVNDGTKARFVLVAPVWLKDI